MLAIVRMIPYALLTLVLIPVQLLANGLRLPLRKTLPRFYHRLVCNIMGIHIRRYGNISRTSPTLFVANHSSYLDIEILGAILPASFIAKDEISDWPGFGFLAKLQRSVFIDRSRRTLAGQTHAIHERLKARENLILFPEGGSYTGLHLHPFRSSLFAVAQDKTLKQPLVIQPITVVYDQLDGCPLGRNWRRFYSWNGVPSLFRHMFFAAGLGTLGIKIFFHTSRTIHDYDGDRKALCASCFNDVQNSLSQALAGR